MNSKTCDQITCGIISVMAVIYAVMSRNLLFTAVAVVLCVFMWWSVCFRDADRGNINFAGTAHNTNVYLTVLTGLYVTASSGLPWDAFPAVRSFFMNTSVIVWIVVMILGRFLIKLFFDEGYIRRILGILLNSVLNVAVTGYFVGRDSAMYQLMLAVTVFAALLSLSRVLQNAASAAVMDTSWAVIVMLIFMLVDTVMGSSRLYSWFVLGEYTVPVWWVTIGLLAVAAVNLSVQLVFWKRASFGASIILFLAALYYGKIFGTGFHLGMVIICALLADLTVKYLIGKNIIKDKTYELLIAYAFFVPATLLFSAVAARHNDLILIIAAVLLLCVFAVINWKLPVDYSAGIFVFGMVFSLLFLSVRYVNGGKNTVLLVFIAAVFWLLFAVGFGRNRLYKTAVEDLTMSGIMKYVLYLFAAASLCLSLYTATQMKTVFYLEKQKTAAVTEIKKLGEKADDAEEKTDDAEKKKDDAEKKKDDAEETDAEEKEADDAEKAVQPVIVTGVLKGSVEEIKSITMEWDGEQAITCTAEEAAAYSAELPSSKVKITLEMKDGSSYVNQQYFLSGKKDEDSENPSEQAEEEESAETSETKKEKKKK